MVAIGPHCLLLEVNQPYLQYNKYAQQGEGRRSTGDQAVLACLPWAAWAIAYVLGGPSRDENAAPGARQRLHAADLLCVPLCAQQYGVVSASSTDQASKQHPLCVTPTGSKD